MKRGYALFYTVTAAVLLAAMIIAVSCGAMRISPSCILRVFTGNTYGIPDNIKAVILYIRLPRMLCAALTGCGLAAAGVIFQGILQNPLADPYTIGISSGASFGAAFAVYINMVTGLYLPVTVFSLVSALITLAAVIAVSRRGAALERSGLIIAGMIVSSVMSAGVSMLKMISGENVGAIVFRLMGSFSAASWRDVFVLAALIPITVTAAAVMSRRLDIMALGDRNAEALGVNTSGTRLIFLITGALMTAACVSVSGIIGFVGLVVPHMLRMKLTARNTVLLPASALTGAALLLLADTVSRLMPSGEIPVGVLTTVIGGPFFIYIFLKKR